MIVGAALRGRPLWIIDRVGENGRPRSAAPTNMARKIIVYIATSADGFIARRDGGVDWLDRPRTAGDYGMGAFYKTIDAVLWGRKTYDLSIGMIGGR